MVRVKLFVMQKDEDDILNDWIIYHAHLFGLENIYLIDNYSGEASKSIIEHYQRQGLNVYERPDYAHKGEYLCELIRAMADDCDIAIPMDLDEFIGVISFDNAPREPLIAWARQCLSFNEDEYLGRYPEIREECKVHKETPFENFVNRGYLLGRQIPSEDQWSDEEALAYAKEHKEVIMKHYPQWTLACDREQIWAELERLPAYGRYAFYYYLASCNTELEYPSPIEDIQYFHIVDLSNYEGRGNFNKKFFWAKSLVKLDHGNHHGTVQDLYQSQCVESRLCLYHYHHRGWIRSLEYRQQSAVPGLLVVVLNSFCGLDRGNGFFTRSDCFSEIS